MSDPKPSRSASWEALVRIVTGLFTRRPEPAPDPGQGEALAEIKQGIAEVNQGVAEIGRSIDRHLSRPWYKIPIVWVALLGEVALIWQVMLTRDQVRQQAGEIERQAADTAIVRRAQLLATIYDCAEPGPVTEPPPGVPELLFPVDPTPRICPPKAHPRARAEAVKALAETDGTGLSLLSADLSGLNFIEANLRGADLAKADLTEAQLSGAELGNADLRRADLSGAELGWADLTEASLRGAQLSGAELGNADLRRADLDADLSGAYLGWADLSGANLGWADLTEANLRGADLTGAILLGADLSTARRLTQDQIDSALGNAETILPDHLTHPDHWLETDSTSDQD